MHKSIPWPAHAQCRRALLPRHRPKPMEEDPDTPRRVQAILDSTSYRQVDRDTGFLNLDEILGVRLLIDYQKPCCWRRAFNLDFLVDEGIIDEEDRE